MTKPRGVTSRRLAKMAAAGVLAVLIAHCGSDGECLRLSDCTSGMTCTNGRCVVAAETADATEEEEVDAAAGDASVDSASDATLSGDTSSTGDTGLTGADGGSADGDEDGV